jgi:ATP-dependent Clp protease ATP-binding subunit ClpA
MFERFDDEVRAVLVGVPQDAAAAGSTTTEAEHLLLGLASAPTTKAGRILHAHGVGRAVVLARLSDPAGGFSEADASALASVGVDLDAVQRAADEVFGEGAFAQAGVRPARGSGRFGESAKAALAASLPECLSSRSKEITTVHLLLGLLRDPNGRCSALLDPFGLDYDAVRDEDGKAA